MLKLQCLIPILALLVVGVRTWDFAITSDNQLEFYTNSTKTHNEGAQFKDLRALAYDAVHNMLLFVDKQSDNASIFSFNLSTKKYQSLVRKKSYEHIQDLAFDPVESKLFWTDSSEKSIFWMSLKPGADNDVYGKHLITMDDEVPRAIAVDSCRSFIYWTNINISKATIERARFDGSEREVIISKDIYKPVSIAVDQRTKKLYWADDKEGDKFSIESSDLDGKNRNILLLGTEHMPDTLTVSKDSVYWVDSAYKAVWQLPKNASGNMPPKEVLFFQNEVPFGIAANYRIEDQTQGIPVCNALTELAENRTSMPDPFGAPRDFGMFCVHGVKVNGKQECECPPGYTGERCGISVCHNYCLRGDCVISNDGKPKCSCKGGFSGDRCHIDSCQGYCLNNGLCSHDDNSNPTCQCIGDFEGVRCEVEKIFTTTTMAPKQVEQKEETKENVVQIVKEPCDCSQNKTVSAFSTQNLDSNSDYVVCDDSWSSISSPIIIVLGVLCGLLCLLCAFLITKIMQLKRRPRIKKRIIVNKNVTPMTARPDQCEITIENCCNMNICETPCFEPRNNIRPTLLDAKPGKEEKRNLISNIEYPEDY